MRPGGALLLRSQGAGSGGLSRQAETSADSARKASTSLTRTAAEAVTSSPDTSLEVSVVGAVAVLRVCHLRSHGSRLGFQVATSKPVGPVLVVPLPAEAPDPKATVAPTGSFTDGLASSELGTSPGALESETLAPPPAGGQLRGMGCEPAHGASRSLSPEGDQAAGWLQTRTLMQALIPPGGGGAAPWPEPLGEVPESLVGSSSARPEGQASVARSRSRDSTQTG